MVISNDDETTEIVLSSKDVSREEVGSSESSSNEVSATAGDLVTRGTVGSVVSSKAMLGDTVGVRVTIAAGEEGLSVSIRSFDGARVGLAVKTSSLKNYILF